MIYMTTNCMTGYIKLINDLIKDSDNTLDEVMQIISVWDMYGKSTTHENVLNNLRCAIESYKLHLVNILDDIDYIGEHDTQYETKIH